MTDYHQTQRQTAPPKRNTVPFIADVLKARELNGKGVYQHTEAELVSVSNQWEQFGRYLQHVTIDDGKDKVEIVTENLDPTMCLTDDDCGVWYNVKLRWTGEPNLGNLSGIIQEKIEQ